MIDPYSDFQFILAFLRHHKLWPTTAVQVKKYTITFSTVNRKKNKEFGLTVRLIPAEKLQRADGARWHCYAWRSRKGRLDSCTQFLSKKLYWLRALLLRRSKSQMYCFQIHPRMPPTEKLCSGGKAILLRLYRRPTYKEANRIRKYARCTLHEDDSECAEAVSSYCDVFVKQQRLIGNLPSRVIDGGDFFWMTYAIRAYTLPQLALIFAQMQLPAYVSLHILSFVIGDSCYLRFFPSAASLVVLFQLAREMPAANHCSRPLLTEKMRVWLTKRWNRARRR